MGHPSSRTSARKSQLKILTNNHKEVSQRRLVRNFGVSHMTICRELSKMNISEAVNSNIDVNECLEKRLLLFTQTQFIFSGLFQLISIIQNRIAWIDENVKFVPKKFNPLNVLQVRPIENFWVCLAQKVYEGGFGS